MATKKILQIGNDASLNIALDTIKKGKQALVFVNSKRSAEKTAEEIAKKNQIVDKKCGLLAKKILGVLSKPTKQCKRLAACVEKGTAFHHAGLTYKQRELIEDNFRSGVIKIISSTPTLAAGIDLPAFRAIIRDLKRFGPMGMKNIPVLEYLQMAGRAGRPSYDSFGEAICLAGTEGEKDAVYDQYIMGEPEDIYSKLAVEPVLRTYLLSLIASNFLKSKEQIIAFFEKTFWAYQFKDMHKLEGSIQKMLMLLEEWEFISSTQDEFVSASDLDNIKFKATLLGKRVAELYLDPLTAHELIKGIKNATAVRALSFSFLQLMSYTLEMRPLLNVPTREYDIVQEELNKYADRLLMDEPSFYDDDSADFMKSIKTAMLFDEWINEKDEEYILERFGVRPGELKVKLDIADWLFYSCQEIVKILQFPDVGRKLSKLRLRLSYGIKEELFALIRIRNIGRVRARNLFKNGVKDVRDIKNVDIIKLTQIIGKATALKVKKEVGLEIKEVPKGTRKGQLSIKKFK